jgi:glycosyltransferase involved in cell wall biosynthesis
MELNKAVSVSIIVPVYNVEQYLAKCLDSLIGQTLKNIEIILINDCSTDQSEDIIFKYQKIDSRIVYLKQKKNQGQGFARNYAIKEARGEYILFVDSDDYIALNAAEILYNKAKEQNLDILEANYYRVYPTHKKEQKNEVFSDILTGNQYFEKIPFTVGVIWNKLWRKEFILKNNLTFVKEIFEDVIFISEATLVAKRVFRMEFSFYYYMIRENSTMTSKVTKKHIDSQLKLVVFLENSYLSNKSLDGTSQRLKLLLYSFSSLATFIVGFKPLNKSEVELKLEAKTLLKNKHKLYKKEIFLCNKLGNKQKTLLFLSPYLMSFVLNKIKKD